MNCWWSWKEWEVEAGCSLRYTSPVLLLQCIYVYIGEYFPVSKRMLQCPSELGSWHSRIWDYNGEVLKCFLHMNFNINSNACFSLKHWPYRYYHFNSSWNIKSVFEFLNFVGRWALCILRLFFYREERFMVWFPCSISNSSHTHETTWGNV